MIKERHQPLFYHYIEFLQFTLLVISMVRDNLG